MESATLAATGRLAGVIRAVSDTPEEPIGRLAMRRPEGRTDWGIVLRALLNEPRADASDAVATKGGFRVAPRRGRRAGTEGDAMSKRVLVASPRSFCAGVVRAIDIVEKLLERHGPPVYVRHEIVHNVHVVRDLEARGAVFVDSEDDVPEGALVVLSAHGVAPQVYEKCAERGLQVIDVVCPLVSKVHAEARQAARGHKIALVGHAGTSRSRARWARRPTRSSSSRPRRTWRIWSWRKARASPT